MSDFKAKMHKFPFHRGSAPNSAGLVGFAPDSAGGAYSASQTPQLYLKKIKGLTSRGRGRGSKGKGRRRKDKGEGG